MADITVTLTSNQVQQGLTYARKVYPDASNADLTAMLEDAAYWGPGVRDKIAEWEIAATRQTENDARKVAQEEFLEDFPAKVEPEPEPEQLPA